MPIEFKGPRNENPSNGSRRDEPKLKKRGDSASSARSDRPKRGPEKRQNVRKKGGETRRSQSTRDGLPIRVDPETGEEYVELPKSEYVSSSKGAIPVLQVEDMAGFMGLDESTLKYLPGRMRKAPSRDEREKLRAEYEREQIRKAKQYEDKYKNFYDDNDDNDSIDDIDDED